MDVGKPCMGRLKADFSVYPISLLFQKPQGALFMHVVHKSNVASWWTLHTPPVQSSPVTADSVLI